MKARVKSTGVLIDVIPKCNVNDQHSADNLYVYDNMVFRECELDFLNVGNSIIDWEQRRYEIAKQIFTDKLNRSTRETAKMAAEKSIMYADIFIDKLKQKQ